MEKTITLDDLKAYIGQLAPDDVVGECASFYNCLIAKTAKWKYPHHTATVRFDNTSVELNKQNTLVQDFYIINLSEDVTLTATRFDDWPGTREDRWEPTKAELMVYMPELFE